MKNLWKWLLILALVTALCCGMAMAETVYASLDDLTILQKTQRSGLDMFSYTYSVDGPTITVNTVNLPANWRDVQAVFSFYDSDRGRYITEDIELSSENRLTWTGTIPSYITSANGEFYALSLRYCTNAVTEEVKLNDQIMVSWYLQDDNTQQTLDYADNVYTYYPDESTNRRYYYNADRKLTSILIVKEFDGDENYYTYSADGSIIKIATGTDDAYCIYQPTTGWINRDNQPVTPPANADTILADAEQVSSELNIINTNSAEIIASGTCGNNLTWTLDSDGALTISGSGAMTDFSDLYSTEAWLPHANDILSVMIGENITSIGNYAFSFTRFESITIPSNITSIGEGAFNYSGLKYVALQEGVTSIDSMAFYSCGNLKNIIIPSTVTYIGSSAFEDCGELTDVVLPEGITAINSMTFDRCISLRSITIPSSVIHINFAAFNNCTGLQSVTIQEGTTSIGEEAFHSCNRLTNITIPATVTEISSEAFSSCSCLTDIYYSGTKDQWNEIAVGSDNGHLTDGTVTIHCIDGDIEGAGGEQSGERDSFTWTLDGNVLSIDGEYYYNDDMPENVLEAAETVIFSASIEDINNLEDFVNAITFQVDTENTEYNSNDGVLFNNNNTILVGFPRGRSGAYTIPEGVEELGFNSFYGSSLESITLPQSLVTIGDQAVYLCPNLEEITVPANVTNIVGAGCNFRYCWSFTDFHVDPANTIYEDRNGILYLKSSDTLYMYPYGRSDNSITITATTVANAAFVSNRTITEITFANGIKQIGESAFADSAVTTITLPVSIESIGEYAFGDSALTTVYYLGNEEQWNEITIESGNDPLTSADIFYNYQPSDIIASGICGDNLTWTLDSNGLLTISGNGEMNSFANSDEAWREYRLDIQNIIIENGVASIGPVAFQGCRNMVSVTIPDSVTSIGQSAFASCLNLPDIYIPDSVVDIGYNAFSDCISLTSVVIPNSVTRLAGGAFRECYNLVSITIPNSVTSIDADTFMCCYKLTNVTLPNSLISIGTSSFEECNTLTSITIPDSVTSISSAAFLCAGLTSITIPASVTSIGNGAFEDCPLSTIYAVPDSYAWTYCTNAGFGDKLVAIGQDDPTSDFTFSDNSDGTCTVTGYTGSDTSIVIPEENGNGLPVVAIGEEAFTGKGFTSVIIPSTVTQIGSLAFSECDSLETVTIPDSVTSIGYSAFSYCWALSDLTIPDSVVTIGSYAFAYTDSLTTVTIPAGVTSIGNGAFAGSTGLTAILVADGNTHYKSVNGVLYNKSATQLLVWPCGRAVNCTIPDGVTGIGDSAFNCCYSLSGVTIPVSVTSIGNGAFLACENLQDIYYTGTQEQWNDINIGDDNDSLASAAIHYNYIPPVASGTCGDNLTWTLDSDGLLTISGTGNMDQYGFGVKSPWYDKKLHTEILSVIIAEGVTDIGDCAFSDCSNIASIVIPSSVTAIGMSSFGGCRSLTSVTIPNSVTYISSSAFAYCTSLTSVTIPNGISSLEEYIFTNCTNLKTVNIPASVTNIGQSAFEACSNLQDIYYAGTQEQWNAVAIGDDNDPLTSAAIHYTIPPIASGTCGEDLTWTLDSDGILTISGTGAITSSPWSEYRDDIQAIVLAEGVTSIPEEAFSYCHNLVSVTLPDGLVSIGELAFYHSSLSRIIVPSGVETKPWTLYYISEDFTREVVHKVALPASVTTVRDSFWATHLPEITPDFRVPSDLRVIESEAFSGISASFVWLSNSTTTIGSKAFANCSNLRYVRIPEGCSAIAVDAFPKGTILLIPEYDSYIENFAETNGYAYVRIFLGGGNG